MRLLPAALTATALAAALALASASQAGDLTLALNHSTRLALAGPAASVVVGNPAVADVTVVDSRTVFVSGRAPGSTDVAVLDPLGRTLFNGDVRVTSQAGAHVVVHHGVGTPTDMACDPTCVAAPDAGGFKAPGQAPAPGMTISLTGGAVAGAAPVVSKPIESNSHS